MKRYLLCITILLQLCITQNALSKKNNLPTIAIVTTGGTIASQKDPATGAVIPVVTGNDLVKQIPQINNLAQIEVFQHCIIDSSQMTPDILLSLSKKIQTIVQRDDICGVIVIHGTDTIEDSAFFLDLTVQTEKPIVLVGAMRDGSSISPDGPENIYNAVVQVTSPEAQHFGVTVTLNQYINAARDVRKTKTTNVQTFNSGPKGYLGYIFMDKVIPFRKPLIQQTLPLPETIPFAPTIKTFIGDDGSFIRYAVDKGARGVVIEGLGAGNVNEKVYEAILYALEKDVAVVLTTRVLYDGVFPLYGGKGGGNTLYNDGVILAGDLTTNKAHILLSLCLGNNFSMQEIQDAFNPHPSL